MERRALIAGLYGAVATGSFYGFSVYSVSLKHQCGLRQSSLQNINTLPYALGVFSPMIGSAFQRLLGVRGTLLIGGVLVACGLMSQFILATNCTGGARTAAPVLLVVFSCVTYIGTVNATGTSFPVPVLWWPRNRSQVTAAVKSFVGLGGAVVAQTFRLAFGVASDSPTALYCMPLWAAVSCSCAAFGALTMPAGAATSSVLEPKRALDIAFGEIALLGVFATATPLAPDGRVHDGMTVGMLALAILPVPLILMAGRTPRKDAHVAASSTAPQSCSQTAGRDAGEAAVPPADVRAQRLLEDAGHALVDPSDAVSGSGASRGPESLQQFTLREMVRTADCWMLWCSGVAVIGSGGFMATSLAFILQAARAPERLVTTTATTFAAGNLLGRLITPVLSELLLVRRGRARAWLLVAICVTQAAAQIGMLYVGSGALTAGGGVQEALVIASAGACGVAFGAQWPMLVILSSELFGRTHLTLNYLFFDGGCAAVGNLVLANLLPSLVYQRAEEHQGNATHTSLEHEQGAQSATATATCLGPACFGPTHGVIAALCLLGAVASTVLAVRSTALYRLQRPLN